MENLYPQRRSFFNRFLDLLERGGNKLPDPVFIFISLCALILLCSWLGERWAWSAVHPAKETVITVKNLLTREGIALMLDKGISNFTSFPALGMVLVVMLGIGLSEKTGYFQTLLTRIVQVAPSRIILPVLIFVGILGNVAGDAAPIVLPPLAAMVFIRLGYHPIAGMVMAYASALGAFAANLILGMSDALVFVFTEPAAKMLAPDIQLNVAMNYYFIAISSFLLLFVIYLVTVKSTIPRFGLYVPGGADASLETHNPTELEIKAMRWANWSAAAMLLIFLLTVVPEKAVFRNAETGSAMSNSPFMNGIGIVMALFFFVPGLVYGYKSGKIKGTRDLASYMNASMASMGGFIVIVFFAAQMMAYFNWSNLGSIMAIKGAEMLKDQSGVLLIVGMILLVSFLNLFVGSASAKWAILAPIFVPMFMLLGYHPGFTQALYRIGDSITNPITPMLAYMPLMLSFAKKYDEKAGLGTLIAGLLPYSLFIGIAWTFLIIVWFTLGLPVGPETPIMLP